MKKLQLSNQAYDIIKRLITVVIPALTTLFNLLAITWDWNIPLDAIDTTIAGIVTCLGTILGISSANYSRENGGEIKLNEGTKGDET